MKKSHTVIVTTWAAVALATTLLISASAGPAGAAATNPATTTQATTGPATTQSALTASCVPDPNSFCAFDVPSDDGTGIFVKWAKPAEEPKGLTYVVQVARSKADFQAGKFKTRKVAPSPAALTSAKPQYFGYARDANQFYFTTIAPSDLFEPVEPGPLTAARLKEFADKGVIARSQLDRAMAAIRLLPQPPPATEPATQPASGPTTQAASEPATMPATSPDARKQPKLTAAQQAELKWYQSLAAYLTKLDGEYVAAEISRINSAPYCFRLAVLLDDHVALVERDGVPVVIDAQARANLFKWGRLNNLVLSLVFSAIVLTFIEIAKQRPGLFIRRIAGLEAIDEAIGRATEMDRPVFFVHGLAGVDNVATIAAVNILSHIARRTAEHDSRLRVTNIDPIVTAVSQEVVQQAYTEAGRPDAYNADDVSLVAYDQFSYTAAVAGTIVREQPGAIFYLGSFAAESLLLAETGASTGAIQVAGTEQYTQLPFFITTCDYTLIGEELFAASAYLSREPRLLGGLRGQDVGKAFIMITLVLGTILLTVAVAMEWDPDWVSWLRRLLEASMT